MVGYVLDASALLALLQGEVGSQRVAVCIKEGALISAVNFAEVATKLCEAGMPESVMHEALDMPGLMIVDFDSALAYRAALLRLTTKHIRLSLGDRVCLALGGHMHLPVVTTDRIWESLTVGVDVQVIRS